MKILALISWLSIVGSQLMAQPCITVSTTCNGSTDYCGPYELSNGIYRIPFANGTEVTITNDHFTHCPRGRIDMVGNTGDNIVAAADGWIRWIDDENNVQCDCSQTFCLNNYIWIEHQNGEWTKYTHMQYHSVPSTLEVGDWVTAGTFLGLEGQVGCASGVHLHFEVAQPVDTNTLVFDPDGGYIDGDWAKNMIPVFCDITSNVAVKDQTIVTASCSSSCTLTLSNISGTFDTGEFDADIATTSVTANTAVTFNAYSSALYQAGVSVTLGVGFTAASGSDLTARIGACNAFPDKMSEQQNESSTGESDDSKIKFYPNPSDEIATIEFEMENDGEVSLMIVDVSGRISRQILNEEFPADHHFKTTINTSQFSNGLYLCVMKTDNRIFTKKFSVQH